MGSKQALLSGNWKRARGRAASWTGRLRSVGAHRLLHKHQRRFSCSRVRESGMGLARSCTPLPRGEPANATCDKHTVPCKCQTHSDLVELTRCTRRSASSRFDVVAAGERRDRTTDGRDEAADSATSQSVRSYAPRARPSQTRSRAVAASRSLTDRMHLDPNLARLMVVGFWWGRWCGRMCRACVCGAGGAKVAEENEREKYFRCCVSWTIINASSHAPHHNPTQHSPTHPIPNLVLAAGARNPSPTLPSNPSSPSDWFETGLRTFETQSPNMPSFPVPGSVFETPVSKRIVAYAPRLGETCFPRARPLGQHPLRRHQISRDVL